VSTVPSKPPQKRDFFRIPFPVAERPKLLVGLREYEVLDLSERGAKIAASECSPWNHEDAFTMTIRFKDGTSVTTTAELQRREVDHLILRFSQGLPYSIIVAQQRRLLHLFPRCAGQQGQPDQARL
jgi:hypothetical protein